MKPAGQTVLAFVASALVAFFFRSRDLFIVDGAPRCLTAFKRQELLFHPNNHLLYLVDVRLWTRLCGALGFAVGDPLNFVLSVDMMNGIAAAVCIAVLYRILLEVTSSWKVAAVVCAAYGLTNAFLEQATNPNEPMVGVCWSFLGIAFAILSTGKGRTWLLIPAGLWFVLAMATYRSTVLLAPAAAMVVLWPAGEEKPPLLRRLARVAVFGLTFFAGCALVFGWAYGRMGVPRSQMFSKFLRQEDSQAYFDPSPLQWVKLPLGLIRNVFPVLRGYNGMRGFLSGPRPTLVLVTCLVAAVWLCLLFCFYTLVQRWARLNAVEKSAAVAVSTGLVFTLVPLVTWNPQYGKFWIQPLACLAVLVAMAYRQFAKTAGRAAMVCWAVTVLFFVGIAFNLPIALHYRAYRPFEFDEAHRVTQFVGEKDLVVLDRGSDNLSVMYAYLWADDNQLFPFVDEAVVYRSGALRRLDDAIRETQATGRKVFFLGLLNVPKPTWNVFLRERCGVPYESFDGYRRDARVKGQFYSREGTTYLWELSSQQGN